MKISELSVNPKNQIRTFKWLLPALMLTAFVSCGEQEPLVMNEVTPTSLSAANERLAATQPATRQSIPASTSQVTPANTLPGSPATPLPGSPAPGAPATTSPGSDASASPAVPAPGYSSAPTSTSALAASAPTILKSTPADMAKSITNRTREIVAAFNKPMDASTINEESFTLACMGTPQTGTVTYAANTNIATLTLPEELPPNSNCVATISNDVKDSAGAAMRDDFSWSFDTAAATFPVSSN